MKTLNLNFLRQERIRKGITLKTMANLLGLKTGANYYKYEVGIYDLKADMLPLLARKLNCPIEKFFS